MNKGFWKGLGYYFIYTTPLYLMINGVFWILQKLGIVQLQYNFALFIIIYIAVILIYLIGMKLYFKNQSSKNLEKLKNEVEELTNKKLT